MTEDPPVPAGVDPTVPSPARLYDYYLGGRYNFPADRAAAKKIIPLSVLMEERIAALRDWAKLRTRPASVGEEIGEAERASVAERILRIARDGGGARG